MRFTFTRKDSGSMKDGKSNISIITEWKVTQDRFMKADNNMKLHIKEKLRNNVYPETTNLKPLSEPVKTKGALKKVKPTKSDNSIKRHHSYFEHIDSHFSEFSNS